MNRLIVFLAEGFGSGRAPKAPGTFGSLVGVLWFYVLLSTGSWLGFWIGTAFGIALSIWICGKAETILGKHDPGSIVLDEIVSLPLTYSGWLLGKSLTANVSFSQTETPAASNHLPWIIAGFVLFRLFDIWKPWPIRRLQELPAGWGVTADDVGAGLLGGGVLFLAVIAG